MAERREVTLRFLAEPTAVPPWRPVSVADKKLEQYAIKLMDLRRGIEEEMRQYLA